MAALDAVILLARRLALAADCLDMHLGAHDDGAAAGLDGDAPRWSRLRDDIHARMKQVAEQIALANQATTCDCR